MSLIQWKRLNPSKVLVIFQHMHAGLTFNRNGETFPDSYIVLKSNEELLGNWTEIIFNTNWHPDPKKGFMKVWIDRKLKVDFKGQANSKDGKRLNLRYGLYSSYMSYYKNTYNNNTLILPKIYQLSRRLLRPTKVSCSLMLLASSSRALATPFIT